MSKVALNEQRKLTATYLNGIAIAFVTVGVLAPIVALLTGAVTSPPIAELLAVGCIVVSVSYITQRDGHSRRWRTRDMNAYFLIALSFGTGIAAAAIVFVMANWNDWRAARHGR